VLVLLTVALSLAAAKPSAPMKATFLSRIIGGADAERGEFPSQLAQTRAGTHTCGGTLLDSNRALTAAHCVDGTTPGALGIIAGLHLRTNLVGTQSSDVMNYVVHEEYNVGPVPFPNDIAIINLASPIIPNGNVQFAILPPADSNFTGSSCVISGWGRTSTSNILPNILQKATTDVISTFECNAVMAEFGTVWDSQVCVFNANSNAGHCNGDSGGPLSCPLDADTVVAGIASWGITANDNCIVFYPSVYTSTSSYLTWIDSH
jgi:secreted trypsin-like serine protease